MIKKCKPNLGRFRFDHPTEEVFGYSATLEGYRPVGYLNGRTEQEYIDAYDAAIERGERWDTTR